jgi:hypothetical protein
MTVTPARQSRGRVRESSARARRGSKACIPRRATRGQGRALQDQTGIEPGEARAQAGGGLHGPPEQTGAVARQAGQKLHPQVQPGLQDRAAARPGGLAVIAPARGGQSPGVKTLNPQFHGLQTPGRKPRQPPGLQRVRPGGAAYAPDQPGVAETGRQIQESLGPVPGQGREGAAVEADLERRVAALQGQGQLALQGRVNFLQRRGRGPGLALLVTEKTAVGAAREGQEHRPQGDSLPGRFGVGEGQDVHGAPPAADFHAG